MRAKFGEYQFDVTSVGVTVWLHRKILGVVTRESDAWFLRPNDYIEVLAKARYWIKVFDGDVPDEESEAET